MTVSMEEKYGIIRKRDERFALELATRIIEKPRASAWIILLPFLFIFHVYWLKRYENNVQTFVSQYLHPKILALDAALEECMPGGSDRTSQEHAVRLPDEHAEELRRRELREMELLKKHYRLLLSSRGSSYPSLLRNAYRTSGEYRFFLNRLIKAEEALNRAVVRAQPAAEVREVVRDMERYADQLREHELKQIFN
jgi:hypothetical protein